MGIEEMGEGEGGREREERERKREDREEERRRVGGDCYVKPTQYSSELPK